MKTKFYFLITFVFLTFAVSAQKVNVMLTQGWVNNAWTDTLKTTSTYDANGNLIKLTTEAWDPATSAWGNALTITYTLNPDNTIKETLTQVWVAETNSFQDLTTSFTYSATKKKLTETTSISIGPLSGDISKTTYTYNDKDSLATQLDQVVDPITLQLTNTTQTNFTYNPDGTLNQHISQSWDSNQWVNSVQDTITYNASKQMTSSLAKKWVNNAWQNNSRNTFTYNPAGTIAQSVEESWVNNAWVNSSKVMYSYNNGNKITEVVTQNWNATTAQWENEARITYNYSTGINPVELSAKGSVVYPNPFEDLITIESSSLDEHSVQLFNAVGQLINSLKTNESVTKLDLGGLNKGVYLMKIKTANQEQTIKLLKSR
ncbi:MAG TPA: hypothetical protein DCL77_08355 [Prolixibacteraceae bacterium]|jgi:hypothetical protein|nr:hypothetical protein [Prolixibacteraceae bacterium]